MWSIINTFLDQIAESQDYDRDELTLIADLCGDGGPTIFPDPERNNVLESVTAAPDAIMPNGWYDDIGSNHIDYRVVRTIGSETTKIPITLYSFQHHPLAGCCMFGLNRWVRSAAEWSPELQRKGLAFRKAVASHHGCTMLFMTKGPSGDGRTGELYDELDMLFDNGDNSLYGIAV